MSIKVLARGKAKISTLTTEQWMVILTGRRKRKYDSVGAFTYEDILINNNGGNGNDYHKQSQSTGKYNQCFKQELYTN